MEDLDRTEIVTPYYSVGSLCSSRPTNVSLQQMAYYYPQSREGFGRISGVGAAKQMDVAAGERVCLGYCVRCHGVE